MDSYREYLLNKEVQLPLKGKDDVKDDPVALASVADLIGTEEKMGAFETLVMSRVAWYREELLLRASPYEVNGLRDTMVALLELIKDARDYRAVYERYLEQEKKRGAGAVALENNSVVIPQDGEDKAVVGGTPPESTSKLSSFN